MAAMVSHWLGERKMQGDAGVGQGGASQLAATVSKWACRSRTQVAAHCIVQLTAGGNLET